MLHLRHFQRLSGTLRLRRLVLIACAVALLCCAPVYSAAPKRNPLRQSREPPWRMDSAWSLSVTRWPR